MIVNPEIKSYIVMADKENNPDRGKRKSNRKSKRGGGNKPAGKKPHRSIPKKR